MFDEIMKKMRKRMEEEKRMQMEKMLAQQVALSKFGSVTGTIGVASQFDPPIHKLDPGVGHKIKRTRRRAHVFIRMED